MERQNISSGTKWESQVGYSRAVYVDNHIYVSGTTATNRNGNIVGIDNPYAQMKQALSNVERALDKADASIEDVVRTRMFVTNIEDWDEIGRAHSEVFSDVRPATSMLEVSQLISSELLVEVEVDAITRP